MNCEPKNYKSWWKFDEVLTKTILLVFGTQCRINQINHKQPFTESDKWFTILETQLFLLKLDNLMT